MPSTEELLMLLGLKEAEIYLLQKQVRELTTKIAKAAELPKPEE